MKAYYIILSLLIFVAFLSATVWHVNNVTIPTGAPNILRDFTDLQAANNSSSVANGDTLYLYAGNYGGATITKQLTIIGTGYFLSQNPETQFNTQSSIVEGINFNTGSEYSVLTGVETSGVNVNQTDNITIKRNYIRGWSPAVRITSSYNILVYQNICQADMNNYNNIDVKIEGIYINPISGIQIKNNILLQNNWNTGCGVYSVVACLVENNVFQLCSLDVIGSNVRNNILYAGGYNGHETSIFMNNICDGTQFAPDGVNGNQCNKDIPGQVILWSGTTDGRFQLRPGSPAIGAGLNGVDCGAFGGGTAYVLSGMPSEIPSVFFFEDSYVGYTYPFHIKAKSHK